MPKIVDQNMSEEMRRMSEAIDEETHDVQEMALRKLAAALADNDDNDDNALIVHMRFDNHRVEYAIANRPDPTISGVSDAVLMTALICAGRRFDFRKRKKLPVAERASGFRQGGDPIVFKDRVTINLEAEEMVSTRSQHETLQALSIVVQNLAAAVAKNAPPPAPAN